MRISRRTTGALLAGALALAGLSTSAALTAAPAHAASAPTTPIWSTQLDFDNGGAAWSEPYFAALAAKGLTTAELNMPWGTIEPSAGTFSFTIWDQELANAAAAGIQLIPVFWQSGWGGSPAPWITDLEKTSTGAAGVAPDWWNTTEQAQYFTYVENTIQNSIAQPGGYGGAVLDYGFLDAQWDISGSGGGYASGDITEFQNVYLPNAFGTIAAFNAAEGTSYTAFSQVPAQASGQPLFGVFQAFRAWSVEQTYGALTAAVRKITANTPLYYYYGGSYGNVTNYANNPDSFFKLAKQYNVTIIADSASNTGMTLAMTSLGRAYGVKVAEEWTAPNSDSELAAYAVQWLDSYGMTFPQAGGEDFFIHDGTSKDTVGYPIYTSWLPTLKSLSGTYPQQPTALYIDVSQGYGNTNGGSLNTVESQAAAIWNSFQSGLAVVTSQEVANGAVSLSSFNAVLPLNGVDANLTSYKNGGGALLTSAAQLTQHASAYAVIDAPYVGDVQAVPVLAASHTSASLTLADITTGTAYNAPIAINPAGLGLNSGSYYVVNAAGTALPQTVQSNGQICVSANLGAASLAEWTVKAGPVPAGTASSGCPTTYTGATSVSATAGQSGGGLTFLGVGATNQGSDGNLTQITQGGQTAYETWTSAQSGATGSADVYLQAAPMSAVEAAATISMQVTYWATAGQGFTVQYSTPTNKYQNGPSVTSPGTGTWTTATVQLTNAQLGELENGGADLRLAVADVTTPLIVRSITMSAGNSSAPVLAATPSSLSFGSVSTGSTSAARTVTITNSGNAAASVSSISTTSGFAQTNTCGSSIAAGASCTASVTFSPTAAQTYSGNLTVTSTATGSPLIVALSGTGTSSSTNLALNKPISASTVQQNYVPTNAVDGNTGTYWESRDGTWPSSLTVDLGSTQTLSHTVIDLPPLSVWQTRTQTLSVLGSTNNSTWTTIVASAVYTWNPSTGNTVTITFPAGTAYRYVQLNFTANNVQNGAQVSEWQLFG
ncbi:coagulation factor 5/8 type domain protein [Catenulispora acidiphila DSM 44928]|uniref:Coagulation factor 5/8 type domain protein n=1 Tax=Catenulispora acidiphila (strain DSM 44928 / JCM 14897 / NBRC 102108 / NRRL B-24433 / ID139908) TaxID=479433 RepID=C7Q4U5_CATAD|nr:choice-of-anchor D domain-containing protein [Catenulispora acidiphila]ACU73893.1 coagulation factor 5/8 type domain protein [Catenulispora acidiphila DSM 44928]